MSKMKTCPRCGRPVRVVCKRKTTSIDRTGQSGSKHSLNGDLLKIIRLQQRHITLLQKRITPRKTL